MTDAYIRQKIAEALAATDGDKHDAQKLLITWAVRDPQLLLGIAKPHLKAIVAGLIDHEVRAKEAGHSPASPEAGTFSRAAIDDIVASASHHVPADKRRKSALPPPKSTARQAAAMRHLAEAFSKKKK